MNRTPRVVSWLVLGLGVVCVGGAGLDARRSPTPNQPRHAVPSARHAAPALQPALKKQAPTERGRVTPAPTTTPPAEAAGDGYAPIPLERLRQPLPDNEVWVIRTVLLNPQQGTLANPGGWAAPARKLTDERHWK